MSDFSKILPTLNRRQLLATTAASLVPFSRAAAAEQKLAVTTRTLDVKGKAATVFAIEGWISLELAYGARFSVAVENKLTEPTMLHWHGLTPPIQMDGVPMLSGPPIGPGDTGRYSFLNLRTGTHWMHSHMGLQEQKLLAAPMVVREQGERLVDEQEHTILIHDFTFRDPAEILAELQGGGGGHAAHMTQGSAQGSNGAHDTHTNHYGAVPAMLPGMSNDIAYDAMLANDRTLDDPEVVKAEKGGRFRLRIINGAAATNIWIDLGSMSGELIAVDGNAIKPLAGSRFPLAVAQRADIRLQLPPGSGAWPILFQSEGATLRSGIILRSGEAQIEKLSDQGTPGEPLDLSMEQRMQTLIQLPENPVSRTEMLMLTGGGADYVWGLNGKSSMHDVLFSVREGERIEVIMHNMTGMAHPMHLHGHYFKVVAIGAQRIDGALRDTVLVPIGETVTIQFDADNPGTWAFHCHHLYHMNSGMMGAIAYSSAA
jgi:FtsP/CotA-like multicopper oxidase with cupredoxin domain